MENLFKRHANLSLLGVVLFAQLLGLAVQIKVDASNGSTRLIRRWAVAVISPLQKALIHGNTRITNAWQGYFWLRGVRKENEELRAQLDHMKLEQVRLNEDAQQARRLQYLLAFKEQFISKTVAAQVIGSSGSEHSKLIYIDKGSNDGLKTDLAVITPQGVVGKTIQVYPSESQVLLINDQSSGIGAILTQSRLQGILKGAPGGVTMLNYIMADEKIEAGEAVVTSGGDRIFPKGLPVGKVSQVTPGRDMFLTIRVQPAANLSQIEEVLVITEVKESAPDVDLSKGPIRASDILAERLPSVPPKAVPAPAGGTAQTGAAGATTGTGTTGAGQGPGAPASGNAGQAVSGGRVKPQAVQPAPSATATPATPTKPAGNAPSGVSAGTAASKPPTNRQLTSPSAGGSQQSQAAGSNTTSPKPSNTTSAKPKPVAPSATPPVENR